MRQAEDEKEAILENLEEEKEARKSQDKQIADGQSKVCDWFNGLI